MSTYSQLNRSTRSVRLLRFTDHQERDGSIHCHLETFCISEAVKTNFIALSYVWGTPQPNREIYLNGMPFTVRDNLYQALSVLRKSRFQVKEHRAVAFSLDPSEPSETPRPQTENLFWIDALCINQGDLHERGCQVDMMGSIFAGASCVVAWLGPECAGSGRAMQTLEREDPYDTAAQQAASRVLAAREYWERMWIVQEFVLGRRVLLLCGRAAAWWRAEMWQFAPPWGAMESLCYARTRAWDESCDTVTAGERDSLDTLLRGFSRCGCSDNRDRVYALLSLVREESIDSDDSTSQPLLADYTITENRLYYRVLRHMRGRLGSVSESFRYDLSEALDIPQDPTFWRHDLLYSATQGHRSPQDVVKELTSSHGHLIARTETFMAHLAMRLVSDPLGPIPKKFRGIKAWRVEQLFGKDCGNPHDIYRTLMEFFEDFPREEDPETWQCFEILLQAAVRTLPAMNLHGLKVSKAGASGRIVFSLNTKYQDENFEMQPTANFLLSGTSKGVTPLLGHSGN